MVRGKYFEEFVIGELYVSPGRTITETDVVMFAGLSGDYNELHTSAEFASATPFGQRIAHGLLGLAVASGLGARIGFIEGTAIAFMGMEWKFKLPVFIGDTIRLHATVAKARRMRAAGGGIIFFDIELLNQDDKIVQAGTWQLLVKSQDAEA